MSSKIFSICTIPGDGIGPDIIESAIKIVDKASNIVSDFKCNWDYVKAGATFYKETGLDVEIGGEEKAEKSDAIFLGAIGLPDIRMNDGTEIAPHLRFREKFHLYAGVRPVKAYPNSPQKLKDGNSNKINLVILRECTEGLFYTASVHNRNPVANDDEVHDVMKITRKTSTKLHNFAFNLARKRKLKGTLGKVTCVDKANVFKSQALFRKVFEEVKNNFPEINSETCYVDAMALNLIRCPWEYDVLVMENIFGDILSDMGGGLVGGMGMASCAEIGDNHGLFQPAHGSAPDIMGKNMANPIATILSACMMLEYLSEKKNNQSANEAAQLIENAIEYGFEKNLLRPNEFGGDMGTIQITEEILNLLERK
jgi:3-isopropylmalate dehydrogenase|tara:strand:- start:1388 stop:2491 length:1104 start_codon:yes stop_codon:yes gene_type:complete